MAVRSEREKSKMQEKYQIILSQMLREEDNRYCVDCDSKSPRWASWNIGIFICIRCAGFHRNLGVHISKVKSVNLDSWTDEQIVSIQAMGNSRARAVYEANLPDGFRRPQTDSALDSFIRSKYEKRKWIAKEWIPPQITLIESDFIHRSIELIDEKESKKINLSKPQLVETSVKIGNSIPAISSPTSTSNTDINTLNLLSLDESPSLPSDKAKMSSDTVDPLQELFTSIFPTHIDDNTKRKNSDIELKNEFSLLNNTACNKTSIMTNDKILALFNSPQMSATNPLGRDIRPLVTPSSYLSSPTLTFPSGIHNQKSQCFSNNLYSYTTKIPSKIPEIKTLNSRSEINDTYVNIKYIPSVQSPSNTFSLEQLNSQFSQFIPFSNTKNDHTSTGVIMSNMSTSLDPLWQ